MDILTIGEILIDLTQTGRDEKGIPQFAANPGGAPANLAVAAAKLGAQTAFIGRVGDDAFGRYLTEVLRENGVDASGVAVDKTYPTTMAVVSVDARGERDFSFYRSANADVMLSAGDIPDAALQQAKLVHFGSVSLTADPSRRPLPRRHPGRGAPRQRDGQDHHLRPQLPRQPLARCGCRRRTDESPVGSGGHPESLG